MKLKLLLLAFVLFFVAEIVLVIVIAVFSGNRIDPATEKEASASVSYKKETSGATIESNYGFKVTLNKNIFDFYGTSVNKDHSFIDYTEEDILKPNDYVIVTVYPKESLKSSYYNLIISSSIVKDFFEKKRTQYGAKLTDIELVAKNFDPLDSDDEYYTHKLVSKSEVKLGAYNYTRYDYESTPVDKVVGAVLGSQKIALFVTVQNGRPYAIKLYYESDKGIYDSIIKVIEGISYSVPSENVYYSLGNTDEQKLKAERTKAVAGVEDENTSQTSNVRVVASNVPAVVRIATLFCYDLSLIHTEINVTVDINHPLCSGGFGSGFFISSDGYIGTNGHVAYLSPRDVLLNSVLQEDKEFVSKYLQFYYQTTQGILLTDEQARQATDIVYASKDLTQQLLSLMIAMPEDFIIVKKEQSEYAVQLGEDPVKFEYNKEKDLSFLNFSESIVPAKLIAMDYSSEDLLTTKFSEEGFSQSDVALLKIEGNNFPVTRVGSIDELVQGTNITVIGFPGKSENELVSQVESKATATTGLVSSIRKSSGNNKKLIQSDVSIDHGNSGGPALNEYGEVVGIATYGLFEDGGTFNYMRDVDDLIQLAVQKGIKLNAQSSTQTYWDEGLNKFFKNYYSSAVTNFSLVRESYPPHVLANQYTTIAKNKIAKGEDAIDPAVFVIAAIVIGILLVIILVVVVVVIKVRKKSKNTNIPVPPSPTPVLVPQPPVSVPAPPANYTS